jgi:hypothetical protein
MVTTAVERAEATAQAEEDLAAFDDEDELSLDSLDHHRLLYYDDWELVEDDHEDDEDGDEDPGDVAVECADDDGSDNDGYPY